VDAKERVYRWLRRWLRQLVSSLPRIWRAFTRQVAQCVGAASQDHYGGLGAQDQKLDPLSGADIEWAGGVATTRGVREIGKRRGMCLETAEI